MHKIIEIVLAIVRGAFLGGAALHTEILAVPSIFPIRPPSDGFLTAGYR